MQLILRQPAATQTVGEPAGVVVDRAVKHGGFRLEAGDVAVWEGDDPTRLSIQAAADSASVHVVRIRRRDGKAARWVP